MPDCLPAVRAQPVGVLGAEIWIAVLPAGRSQLSRSHARAIMKSTTIFRVCVHAASTSSVQA